MITYQLTGYIVQITQKRGIIHNNCVIAVKVYIITVLLAVKVARQNTLTGENVVEMQPEINSKLKS